VAMHLASLLPEKETVAVASCLGKDQLGNEARRRLQLKGFGLIIFSFMRTGKPVRE
jgi:sugar/nucleoside kinase (ribokinase family)